MALAAALVGILVTVTRSGWLSIFIAVLMVDQPAILPLACVMVLPAWLVVTGRPTMLVPARDAIAVDDPSRGAVDPGAARSS